MQSRHSGPGSRRRRRGGRSRSSSRPRSGDTFHVRREPRKPAGLWDKIKAFFGLAPQPAKPSEGGQERRERTRDESREARPQREPRTPREPRKPEAVEVTSPRLYVGNLSYDAAESDLFDLFSGVGTVANVEIVTNKHTQRSKGFGFVQMTSVSEAKRAVDELHDKDYMGRKLVVSGAKLPPDRAIGRESGDAAPAGEIAAAQEESARQA
ncbi:MAG: hypothetical protein FGM15_00090 [Chthoniobacterales bacterium]|nr:hypothetical protein [Chthoniobacterales bacterium]